MPALRAHGAPARENQLVQTPEVSLQGGLHGQQLEKARKSNSQKVDLPVASSGTLVSQVWEISSAPVTPPLLS